MTDRDLARYRELEALQELSEREFAEYEVLKGMYENIPLIEQFRMNQKAPYEDKVNRAYNLAWEYYRQADGNCYVGVGGLDSIVLYVFLRSIGINVPAVSVSSLEDKSIQRVHKALGVQALKPLRSKVEVIREFGFAGIVEGDCRKDSFVAKSV